MFLREKCPCPFYFMRNGRSQSCPAKSGVLNFQPLRRIKDCMEGHTMYAVFVVFAIVSASPEAMGLYAAATHTPTREQAIEEAEASILGAKQRLNRLQSGKDRGDSAKATAKLITDAKVGIRNYEKEITRLKKGGQPKHDIPVLTAFSIAVGRAGLFSSYFRVVRIIDEKTILATQMQGLGTDFIIKNVNSSSMADDQVYYLERKAAVPKTVKFNNKTVLVVEFLD